MEELIKVSLIRMVFTSGFTYTYYTALINILQRQAHCDNALECDCHHSLTVIEKDPFWMFLSILGNDMKSTVVMMRVIQSLMAATLFMIIAAI